MLYALKGKLIEKKQDPIRAIMSVLGCSEKTARNKLNGTTSFTVPEAIKLRTAFFPGEDIETMFVHEEDAETG